MSDLTSQRRSRARGNLLGRYLATMRMSVIRQVRYRVSNYLLIASITFEAIIYLLLWTAVAAAQGGAVAGWSVSGLAGYYLVWTLVRQLTVVLTPAEFEGRIRRGELTGMLLRPMHPLHHDLADFAGWALLRLVLWLPIAAVMYLGFSPQLDTTWLRVAGFVAAVAGSFVIRALCFWLIGLVTFWTVRGAALADLCFVCELLLSGRMLPVSMLPDWARTVADVLPFQWVFSFPVELLLGKVEGTAVLVGFCVQALWIAVLWAAVVVLWRLAVRRHSAVGS